jgi:desulfoferrodoxin (superoxide reductase-like protein)
MEHDFKTPDDVTEFESKMAKEASKIKVIPAIDKAKLEKAIKEGKTKKIGFVPITMAERYAISWKNVYAKLTEWRQKEIDNQLKSGKLSDKDWDTDFVQQVIALAESDDPQAI